MKFSGKKTLIKDFFLQKKTDVIDVSILQMDEVAGYPICWIGCFTFSHVRIGYEVTESTLLLFNSLAFRLQVIENCFIWILF